MMEKGTSEILEENAKEYFRNALLAESRMEFNTAVTLFFKTLFALGDLYIYLKEKKVPSSHSERFNILKLRYYSIYQIFDRIFPFYQDSYKMKLNREVCETVKNDAERLFKILNIKM